MKNSKLNVLMLVSSMAFVSSLSYSNVSSDNTKVNERDRATTQVTADQQGSTQADTEITRKIRQDLIANKDLSMYAHNVKIITTDGHVTLKGPVRSKSEESVILKYARSVDGVSKVTDQLRIAQRK